MCVSGGERGVIGSGGRNGAHAIARNSEALDTVDLYCHELRIASRTKLNNKQAQSKMKL